MKRNAGMTQMTRRNLLTIFAIAFASPAKRILAQQERGRDSDDSLNVHAQVLKRAREFLVGLLDPELNLLPEYSGATVYWLYHDNYLAAKVLSASNPEIAAKIRSAIHREGVNESGKIEILFGEAKHPFPFRQYELKAVRKVGTKVIRTEVVTTAVNEGWKEYADLVLMACIAEKEPVRLKQYWNDAFAMWDGKGFDDPATRELKRYATYKLALALIAAKRIKMKPPEAVLERLLSMQDESGGWITDYDAEGKKIGLANVETTCLSILGIESLPY